MNKPQKESLTETEDEEGQRETFIHSFIYLYESLRLLTDYSVNSKSVFHFNKSVYL